VSLVLMRKTALFRTIIASKMFEAMAMQRPIILGLDGVSRGIVEAAGCGIPIEPENATELAAALTRLAHDPATARAMGEAGSVHVRAHFDRRQLAQRFLAMLASLTGGTPATARAAES
jgi:glycosyltransferase involved in cell wall biosynthesis